MRKITKIFILIIVDENCIVCYAKKCKSVYIYEDTNGNGELDEEDKVVFHTVTKEDGYSEELTFRYGTYFVKETKAPEGYTIHFRNCR